uniref:Uncharacterized protein n=1 Tax=Mycena chlorophos TaxID=658473 RepID=A0ABQ0LRI2_MYCCL|nr:predicted protein [Mycena chlorophos]
MTTRVAVASSFVALFASAAPAPAKVTASVLFVADNGAVAPGEYSASVLGSDAAGHTTYAIPWTEVEQEASRIGTGTSLSQGPTQTFSGIETLVVGPDYISQPAYAQGSSAVAAGLGYQCTFSGSSANCVGYEPIATGTYNPTLQSSLPTAAFFDVVLDVPGNSALGRGPSMVGAVVGLVLGLGMVGMRIFA